MKGVGRYGIHAVVGAALLCLGASGVRADESTKADIEVLKERLSKLEAQQAGAEGDNAIIQLPSGLHGVQMSGFVDTTYTYNLNHPQTNLNTLRVFDTRQNSFMLNNVELVVEKPVSEDSPVGFRTDLQFGTDPEVTGVATPGLGLGTGNELDIQQAYVEYLAPLGNGLDLKAGKFTTLHGAEVTESKDNWNISRSYLFGFAEPLTHTGLRATYAWSDMLTTCLGINNGWDLVDDTNQAKGYEASVILTPIENTSLIVNYMGGGEQAGNNGNGRHLFSLVAGAHPIEALELKLAYDYGWEDDVQGFGDNAVWQGIAAYAKYALTDKWSLAVRGEYFSDADGARTAFNSTAINGRLGNSLRLSEWTFTSEYKLNSHLIARAEYRHDWASEDIFRNRDVGQRSYQDTLAMEFVVPF